MFEVLLITLTGIILVVAALLWRWSAWGRTQLSPRMAVPIIAAVTALALAGGYRAVFPARQTPGAAQTAGPGMLPPGDYPAGTLPNGDQPPPLLAQGWLNGPPPKPGDPGAQLTLVDLWANW